ncbi:MAG: VOC family protein [Ilumatobacter sp.]|uniref:VOC family protein n=1 Tax=Ilumatobacter sp. TaxID=1967498 RepID=UPI002603C022|nr:VOC family protein [Ilumatobacter sp.]MDJ0767802.1 VOC family protein [Ilumatobacter sp.]
MASRQLAIVIDAADPDALREFWVAAMGYEPFGAAGPYRSAVPPAGSTGLKLVFQQVPEPQTATKNRLHLDIIVGDEIEAEAERLVGLGASPITELIVEVGTKWMVLADPEGNEFCLVYDT